jgi:hypothetical protein
LICQRNDLTALGFEDMSEASDDAWSKTLSRHPPGRPCVLPQIPNTSTISGTPPSSKWIMWRLRTTSILTVKGRGYHIEMGWKTLKKEIDFAKVS